MALLRPLDIVSTIGRMVSGISILCDHCHRGREYSFWTFASTIRLAFEVAFPPQRKPKNKLKEWQLGYGNYVLAKMDVKERWELWLRSCAAGRAVGTRNKRVGRTE